MKTQLSDAIRALGYNQTKLRKEYRGFGVLTPLAIEVKDQLVSQGFTTTRANHALTVDGVLKALVRIRSKSARKSSPRPVKTPVVKNTKLKQVKIPAKLSYPPPSEDIVKNFSISQVLTQILDTIHLLLNDLANLDAVVRRQADQHMETAAKLAAIDSVMATRKAGG